MLIAYEDNRVPSEVFHFVERKLSDYTSMKKLVETYEKEAEDVRTKSRQWSDDPPPTLGQESPVERKAIRVLILEESAQKAYHWVKGIEDVMANLSEEERRLVKLRYYNTSYTNNAVAWELNMSRATYYRKREEIIRKFAIRFGLL